MNNQFELEEILAAARPEVRQEIWNLLLAADNEFVPPLSSRQSSTDTALNHGQPAHVAGPAAYFDEISKQPVIWMLFDGRVAGFMSYKTDYIVPELQERVDAYVSTIVVAPALRGQKITSQLYGRLLDVMRDKCKTHPIIISTRTWSTNFSHLKILKGLNFECVYRGADGRGSGIDTVIYKLGLA